MKKIGGYKCDVCDTFMKLPHIARKGKKRVIHLCSLECLNKWRTNET